MTAAQESPQKMRTKNSVEERDHFPSIAGSKVELSVGAETTGFSEGIEISLSDSEDVFP